MAIKAKDKIFFDTDCLSSFLITNNEHILISLYGNRIIVPGIVRQELRKVSFLDNKLSNLQSKGLFLDETMKLASEEFKLYVLLTTGNEIYPKIGAGEASVIALAKCYDATMASNNLKDIKYYIDYYKLHNLTTADILYEALQKNIIILAEAESIWQEMIHKKRFLPTNTFQEWMDKEKIKPKV